jgi:glycerol-3-phosphate dehydrogenase (NAD(P)+)
MNNKPNVTILGNGSWGTALALTIRDKCNVCIWGFFKEEIDEIKAYNENRKYLEGFKLDDIKITHDIDEAFKDDPQVIVSAIPTKFLRNTINACRSNIKDDVIIVSLSKGLEHETFKTPTEIIDSITGKPERIVALSGPSHAEEVVRKLPTAVVVSSKNIEYAKQIQNYFMTDHFRIYSNEDTKGVEIGAAVKNIIAVAAGISDGLGFGDNAKSALMTRGIVEIRRLGIFFGAKAETFNGLTGIGDLITTCNSKYSRNRFVGEEIAKGLSLKEIEKDMNMIAEGVYTVESVYDLMRKNNISMPITEAVYRVLFKNEDPKNAVRTLMTRDPKGE